MKSSQKLNDMDLPTLIKQTRAKEANPGGGAILILVSNLAINLMLMMDKNEWGRHKNQADVSHETIVRFSDELSILMQDDVDYFKTLMVNYKCASKEDFINANKSLLSMIDINIKAMDILSFYLENGKKATLTDGEIANDLLKTANLASLSTIKINMDSINANISYKSIESATESLYKKNKLIIERRNK